MNKCSEHERLRDEVENILAKVAHLTTLQLELFRSEKFAASRSVDKQLELAIGEKERAIGALRQHLREHRCHLGEIP